MSSWLTLDYYFPFVVFGYGFIMTWLLNSDWALRLLETRIHPAMAQQFLAHRTLGLICLVVGALWSAQNLILSAPPV